jgi:hypothetical protein
MGETRAGPLSDLYARASSRSPSPRTIESSLGRSTGVSVAVIDASSDTGTVDATTFVRAVRGESPCAVKSLSDPDSAPWRSLKVPLIHGRFNLIRLAGSIDLETLPHSILRSLATRWPPPTSAPTLTEPRQTGYATALGHLDGDRCAEFPVRETLPSTI